MKYSLRKVLLLSAIVMSALVFLILSIRANPGLFGRGFSAAAGPDSPGDAGNSAGPSEKTAIRATKTDRIRPSAEELARKRKKSRRVELVRKLQRMRDGGLSDQHPAIKAGMEELAGDPDVRTELRDDRTYVLWTRDVAEDGYQLTQYHFEIGGGVALRAVHRVDSDGSPSRSRIYDDKNNEIFKVSYGYRKSDGMLVEERMFDSRDKLLDHQGNEKPVRRTLHGIEATDGSLESKVVDLAAVAVPPQMNTGFKNPFLRK